MHKRSIRKALFVIAFVLAVFAAGLFSQILTASAATRTFGNTSIGSIPNSFGASKDASKFLLSEPGSVQSITAYFGKGGFNAKTAIYADSSGAPGTLIVQSQSEKVNSGWNIFPISQVTLTPGYYWLSVVCDNNKAQGRMTNTGTSNVHSVKSTLYSSEFTNAFGASGKSDSYSTTIFATYTSVGTSATPAASPTPTATSSSPSPAPTPTATLAPAPTSTSTVKLGIYTDASFINRATSITWGQLAQGTTKQLVLYVRNEGAASITLTKSLSNFNPATLASFLSLSWDYNNQPISAGASRMVTLILAVSASAPVTSSFGFATTITAWG